MTVPVEDIDPGIRQAVVDLNVAGFVTSDSGDGVSKPPGEGVIPFAHVAIVSTPEALVGDAARAMLWLQEHDYGHGLVVEATFNPADRSAIILVMWP